jgi:DNA invertase Pin-like site-specific DNA recombinase
VEKKPTVVIAIRVSSEKQVSEGYGYAAQVEQLPKLVEARGWTLAKRPDGTDAIYDEGFASTTPQDPAETSLEHRPVMQALLGELKLIKPTYLVCRQLDRLSRDNYEHSYIVKQMKAAGLEGFAEAPTLNELTVRGIADPRDEAMAGIEAIFANLQKADLKIKLMMGRQQRARDGKPNGGRAPYGYYRPAKKAPLAIHEEEAETYRLMVQLVIDKAWGPAKIAHELVKRGIRTGSGDTNWTATTVRRILMSKAQCGYVRAEFADAQSDDGWVKAKKAENAQPAIVTEATWDKMRAVLDARTSESGHNQRRHPLAGLLRCHACGMTLKAHPGTKRDKAGRKIINYSCRVYNSGCTAGYSISERKALAELRRWLERRLALTENEGWSDVAPTDGPSEADLAEHRIAALERAHAKAERDADRAWATYSDADERDRRRAKTLYEQRRDRADELADSLAQAREAFGAAKASDATSDQPSPEELRQVLTDWDALGADRLRGVLSLTVEKAILGPPGKGPRLTVIPTGGKVSLKKLPKGHGTEPITALLFSTEQQAELKRVLRDHASELKRVLRDHASDGSPVDA